jgi:MoxR-like ATPase
VVLAGGAAAEAAPPSRLAALGVHGFDRVEPVILAALVSEDPLLLVGSSGTGKTYLLNTLSEALGLAHRHYNASLISFDDLVGFPYPEKDGTGVRFLETPATVWRSESVLIDEISRCKPEHQNRLFSLVHERKVQGIALERLRFRWAAMNPCTADQGAAEEYAGSEPLDPALADRFALFVEAVDWPALTDGERRRIADPGGEGRTADDGGALRRAVEGWRSEFLRQLESSPGLVLEYATAAVTALNGAGIRVSPRRSRLLARSLLAVSVVAGEPTSSLFRLVLECSLPHATWGARPSLEAVAAAHRLAWDTATAAADRWIHAFVAERGLARKLSILVDECRSPDSGTQAVAQLAATEPRERAAAFAFAIYPAAAMGKLPVGAEGVNDLAKLASPVLKVDGEVSWQERLGGRGTRHPELDRFAKVLERPEVTGGRAERARQFFSWCLVARVSPAEAGALEAEIAECVEVLRVRGLA